jgi:hypothetical protein
MRRSKHKQNSVARAYILRVTLLMKNLGQIVLTEICVWILFELVQAKKKRGGGVLTSNK